VRGVAKKSPPYTWIAPANFAHTTVAALTADLDHRITTWNDDPRPFVWHKTADQVLDGFKEYRTTYDAGH
jgi:hypothetical protein